MAWMITDGKVVTEDNKIVVDVECCCLIPCPCPPPTAPLPACIFSTGTTEYDGQKLFFFPADPEDGECRRMSVQFIPACCTEDIVMHLVWKSDLPGITSVKLLVSIDGGAETEYNWTQGSCDPFCFVFSNVDIGCGTVDVEINCYSPPTCDCLPCWVPNTDCPPNNLIGTWIKDQQCTFYAQGVTLTRRCEDDECLLYSADCFTFGTCVPPKEMSIRLAWAAGATSINDITLYWRWVGDATWNTVLPSVPPSACDPFCLQFQFPPLADVNAECCSNQATEAPVFEIGNCPVVTDCCCPEFESSTITTLDIDISGGFSGTGQLSDEGCLNGVPTNCACWGNENDPIGVSSSGSECAAFEIQASVYCPPDSTSPSDLRLVMLVEPTTLCAGIPLPGITPDTAQCGPFSATFSYTETEEFCNCGTVTITVSLPAGGMTLMEAFPPGTMTKLPPVRIRGPQPTEPPDDTPEEVMKWLEELDRTSRDT